MNQKQKLIHELVEMQKQFIRREKAGGIDSQEYYAPEEDSEWSAYQTRHDQLANRLIDMAHAEKGSKR